MRYELGKVYRATVEGASVYCSIHFKFFMFQERQKVGILDVYDGEWSNYTFMTLVEIHHDVHEGTWILRAGMSENPAWLFRRKGHTYTPAIYEVTTEKDKEFADIEREIKQSVRDKCGIPLIKAKMPTVNDYINARVDKMMGRHYDQIIFDDMIEEKGGNEMTKYLFHVILFNKETETIDFKEYIPAKDASDASMQAAQIYGKYDSNVHIVIVKPIDYSQYEVKK